MTFQRKNLNEEPVFKILSRPPMIAGMTYSAWAVMLLISVSGIVVLKSLAWFFGLFITFYVLGRLITRYDIFFIEIFLVHISECPMNRNDEYWGCKSYEPW